MKITKTWARKALKAVNILIERYKDGEESGGELDCPFCQVFECGSCPWQIFKGYGCCGYDMDNGMVRVTDKDYDKFPIPQRLPRLYGWRKRLTNIIERGK